MSGNQGNAAAQPATSAELAHPAQRRWSRIKKCEPYVAEFLANTPATARLTNAQKAEILQEVKNRLHEDVGKFGVQWVAGMFDDNPQAPGQAAAQAARDDPGDDA
ncbi:hypothetical protein PG984_011462 [Apiospora sp. TS-2023a]